MTEHPIITTIAQAQLIVDYCKALGFADAKLLFWDTQDDDGRPGKGSAEEAMQDYDETDDLCQFDLGISLGAETYLKRNGEAIRNVLPITKGGKK